jgi:hypothetical protein
LQPRAPEQGHRPHHPDPETGVLDQWLYADLSGLGTVNGLSFSSASSDTGPFGINTPTYFAMDNLTTVPLPGTLWLMGSSLIAMGRFPRSTRQGVAAQSSPPMPSSASRFTKML